MKHFLNKIGLSMSQAQSISNICNQRCIEIDSRINAANVASRVIKIDGEYLVETPAVKLPSEIVELLIMKGELAGTQAFLMEAIKAKEALIREITIRSFDVEEFYKNNPEPVKEPITSPTLLAEVDETWGWNQLSLKETAEYLAVEASASHIGQFIHKVGKLSRLRNELTQLKTLEWIEIETGKKTPVIVTPNATPEELFKLHEELATKHSELEARVNYFKAKVKNLVTLENARINTLNSNVYKEYQTKVREVSNIYNADYSEWRAKFDAAHSEFLAQKELDKKETIALRISVDPRFQSVVNTITKVIKVADKG